MLWHMPGVVFLTLRGSENDPLVPPAVAAHS